MTETASSHVLTPAQLECIASPVRAEILRVLDTVNGATAQELAARLGGSLTRLYHHLATLRGAGLIEVADHRPGPRKPEAVYALIAPKLLSAEAGASPQGRSALAKVCRRFLSTASKRFERALADPAALSVGPKREVSLRQVQVRLAPAAMAELNAEIDAIMTRYSGGGDSGGRAVTLTVVVTPGS